MAKKRPQNPPAPKTFRTAPFDSLKKVAVSAEAPAPPQPEIVREEPEQIDEGFDLFLKAVAGATPLHAVPGKTVQKEPHRRGTSSKSGDIPAADEYAGNLFIQEISRLKLDTKFEDSIPDDGELQPLAGNRLRQVRRGIVSVDHQIDLHGLTRMEALDALARFLKSARQKGQKAALVITGKGHHSAEEPVLQQAVASWLRDAGRDMVVEFAPAPRELGGRGAYVVFLRQPAAGA